MKEKATRIIAIIALAAMAVFTVTIVLVFIDPLMGGGWVSAIALTSGLLGIGLFVVIKVLTRQKAVVAVDPDGKPSEPENNGENTASENAGADKTEPENSEIKK